MCAVASSQKTDQSTTATVTSNVSSVLAAADSTATQQVQGLGLVQQARLARLTRTAAAITAQYGASSTQAQAAQAAVTASTLSVARLAAVNRQITFTPPQAAAKGWSIYGHVYHSTLAPASAYTVFFVDEQNAYQGAVGFVYTGSDGSYQLNYTGDASAPAASQLFLQVVNDQAQPVYLSTTAFQPKTGAATYQDVTLPDGEPALGDPPAEIRAIAMPQAVDKPKK
jgi:hypothetical protein